MTEVVSQPRYGEAEKRRALIEVAACSGNTSMAARALAEEGFEVDQATLWRWSRKQHADLYEQLRQEILPKITAHAAEQHMDLALRQTEVSAMALQEIENRMPGMEDKDLINAMGKADIGSGIHTEKAQLLSGQPTHRAERSIEDLLRTLNGRGLQFGEKRQEPDGSVVERVAVLSPEDSGSDGAALPGDVPPSQDSASPKRA